MTGFGAHLLAIDDPIKGRAEANSQLQRESQWEWYTDVARTRLMARARELLVTTRWHEDDIAGRIHDTLAITKWTVLSLPALAEENDPLGRAPGEALAPELLHPGRAFLWRTRWVKRKTRFFASILIAA